MLQPIQARADEQARVRDAYACMNATIELEKEYQIQEHLLTTISSVETGRWDAATRQNVAWPWTVNAMGKGTFYPSKAEAIRAVKKLQAQGVKSIDVDVCKSTCRTIRTLSKTWKKRSTPKPMSPMAPNF